MKDWHNCFEGALVEAGELRVERPDADHLERVQKLIRSKELVGLNELLKSGRQGLPRRPRQRPSELRTVTISHPGRWPITLTFDRKLLGTKALDEYVHSLRRGFGRSLMGRIHRRSLDWVRTCFQLQGTTRL